MAPSAKPLSHGVVLVAGGTVGAGMFALPIVASSVGFIWATLGLALVWFVTYRASLMLLLANADSPHGASFDYLVRTKLGGRWATLNNLSIAFIMVILMYAYTTAGASILSYTLRAVGGVFWELDELPHRAWMSLALMLAVALLVWAGSTKVSRVSQLIVFAMLALFVLVSAQLSDLVKMPNLLAGADRPSLGGAVLPVFVTAFACGGLVPSLVKHYQGDTDRVKWCLLYGTLASLSIYFVWLLATLGTLPAGAFDQIKAAGGNMGDLLAALVAVGANNSISGVPNGFFPSGNYYVISKRGLRLI